MARQEQRLAANVPGPFYVDSTCIDCGTCWQFDPLHYAPTGSSSRVQRQPDGAVELRQALLALQACPVAAIGTTQITTVYKKSPLQLQTPHQED